MATIGRSMNNSNAAAMRKKRRTIGGFRAHAMGESFDHNASSNFSLGMVPEDQLSCLSGGGGSGSENIVVAVRVRPLSAAEVAEGKRSCCDVLTSNTLVIRKGADPGAYLRSQKGSANEYSFDAVFSPDAGQSEVYEGTAKPHISALLEGVNVTVFAYGATGAGKTHTMMGSERNRSEDDPEEVSGIVPQSLVELFQLLEERAVVGSEAEGETETWAVRVGYLQVYNEQIMDLLSPESKPLKINEDPGKGIVVVAGLREVDVACSAEVLDLLRQGNANRRTEATGANQVSSRSHAVLQVVVTRTVDDGMGTTSLRETKLSLIDLAGSERASATNNRGEQLRQGANINKSLLSLANCINALAGNRRRRGGKAVGNVKYRDSKLTHLLKTSLEGRCRLVMIANVNPSHVFFDDSHNTLKYANRAKNIKVDPRVTEVVRGSSGLCTEKESRLAREYQALKERNEQMEAQLEIMRSSRRHIAPEPAGFPDLFAPNTSSIMSVASSTPGHGDRCSVPQQQQQQQQPLQTAASAGAVATQEGYSRIRARRSGGGGRDVDHADAMPPPAPRYESEQARGSSEVHGVDGFVSPDTRPPSSPKASSLGQSPSSGSGSKRKREREQGAWDEEREHLRAELAAERIRVRELEGRVRELENSVARMGVQQDVNMELIDTFRHQKEMAEEAAQAERATADELLSILKQKEAEATQLRADVAELSRESMFSGSSSSAVKLDSKNQLRSARPTGDDVETGSPSSRLGGRGEGDSIFEPLVQIGEGRRGLMDEGVENLPRSTQVGVSVARAEARHNRDTSGEVRGSRAEDRTPPSPSFRDGLSTTEVASAIKSRRKKSMIPRSRKSMIPTPLSSGRRSNPRRLGDLTNSSNTRLNERLSSGTPAAVKKSSQQRGALGVVGAGGGRDDVDGEVGLSSGVKRRSTARRISSKTAATAPVPSSVSGRTRSRLSVVHACPLRDVR